MRNLLAHWIGLTEGQVRLQFAAEEAQRAELGVPALHDVSPSSFIYAGLALEEEQYVPDLLLSVRRRLTKSRRRVRIQAELKKAKTTGQQISLTGIRTKLTRGIQRFRRLQAVYTPAALQAAATRTAPDASELPEDELLLMPSALTASERTTGCAAGLAEIESRARHAQCRTSLIRVRNQLHVKTRLLTYKKIHSRHQGPNTRSRTIVTRNESKIRLHSEKYQAAWDALARLNGGDPGWRKLRKRDIRLLEDAEELSKRQLRRERQEARRLERERRLIEAGEMRPQTPPNDAPTDDEDGDDERAARGGESVREISWIWSVAGTDGTDADLEDGTLFLPQRLDVILTGNCI